MYNEWVEDSLYKMLTPYGHYSLEVNYTDNSLVILTEYEVSSDDKLTIKCLLNLAMDILIPRYNDIVFKFKKENGGNKNE